MLHKYAVGSRRRLVTHLQECPQIGRKCSWICSQRHRRVTITDKEAWKWASNTIKINAQARIWVQVLRGPCAAPHVQYRNCQLLDSLGRKEVFCEYQWQRKASAVVNPYPGTRGCGWQGGDTQNSTPTLDLSNQNLQSPWPRVMMLIANSEIPLA